MGLFDGLKKIGRAIGNGIKKVYNDVKNFFSSNDNTPKITGGDPDAEKRRIAEAKAAEERERRAEEAERETNKLKKVEYMERHIGEVFEGVVSGVTQWGIYVELPNTVEGMVHVSKLPGDYFLYDEQAYEMVGRDFGIKYKLGQRVQVQVESTDRFLRTIDFVLIEREAENG